jgi:putative transposase
LPIGIDLGLNSFATLSDGNKIDIQRHHRQFENKIKSAQRANNKQRVRRLHAKIKNCRKDFLHKLSTELAARYSLIAVGNVKPLQLAKNHKIAKSVLDAGWSTFRNMLKYKATNCIEVGESFTTVTCSACRERSGPKGQKGLQIRQWKCSDCGENHDRDVNAAKNILIAALGIKRPVEESLLARAG